MRRPRSPTDVRIGIIGCGRAATDLHVPSLARVRGAAIVALCDRDETRVNALGRTVEGAVTCTDYHALLRLEHVDLVAVCVPLALHAQVAAAAFRAGKHVFIEKPLALTLGECEELVALARRAEATGIRSVVGFNLRSHRLLGRAREIIRSGSLGDIELLRTLWTADWSGKVRPGWHGLRTEGGGALFEIGAHQADLWRWLLQSEVESVHAFSRSTTFDDQSAAVQARMACGALVSTVVSQRSASHNVVEVLGSRGSLRLSCYRGDSLEVDTIGAAPSGIWRRAVPLVSRAAEMRSAIRPALGGGDFLMSYVREWERILAALRDGAVMPASVYDGRQASAIVLATLQSAREGAAVGLDASDPNPEHVRAG